MSLKIDQSYQVICRRKGTFIFILKDQCDTWATGVISKGKASAILEYNERFEGEEITVRKSFCAFKEV